MTCCRPEAAAQPDSGQEITLLDLATQRSGLPRLPDNFGERAKLSDPYAGYTASDLYAYLAKHGLARSARTEFEHSNLGFGLLGFALANKAGESYAELIRRQVMDPLAMNDTAVDLSPAQQSCLIQGYTVSHTRAHTWKFDALAGAGALHSTASDLLRYADSYLHPDKLSKAGGGPASHTPCRTATGAAIAGRWPRRSEGRPRMADQSRRRFVLAQRRYGGLLLATHLRAEARSSDRGPLQLPGSEP